MPTRTDEPAQGDTHPTSTSPARALAALGLAAGAGLALLDFACGVEASGFGVRLGELWLSTAATLCAGLAAFASFAALGLALRRAAPALAPRLGLDAAWGACCAVLAFGAWPLVFRAFGLGFPRLPLVRLALASLVVGAVAAVLASRASRPRSAEDHVRRACAALALCVALAATTASVDSVERLGIPATIALFALEIAAACALLAWASRRARGSLAVPATIAALLAVAPLTEPWTRPVRTLAPVANAPRERSVKRAILIVVDTLRADFVGSYEPSARATPHIDALAADSLVFEHASSTSTWTVPAVVSLLTGALPDVHGVDAIGKALPRSLPTLAQAFRAAGYRTAAVGTNVVLREPTRLDRGFEHFSMHPKLRAETPLGARLLHEALGLARPGEDTGDALTDEALAWIDAHAQEDFFLWLHYYDPHSPYQPPERLRPAGGPADLERSGYFRARDVIAGTQVLDAQQRAMVRRYYEAEVAFLDEQLGRFLDGLRARGLYDDSLIAFAADHGEEFWEHGGIEHGHSMHREVLRVPLMLKRPGQPAPARAAQEVSIADLPSTLLALCGLDAQAAVILGEPLLDASGAPAAARPVFSSGVMFHENQVALTEGGFKYVRWSVSGREELYDLAADPWERASLHASGAERLATARERLAERARAAVQQRQALGLSDAEFAERDAQTQRRLEQLGYVK